MSRLVLFVLALALAQPLVAQDSAERRAVPNASELEGAAALMYEFYGGRMADAKTSEERRSLARHLLSTGIETNDIKPAYRYVLMQSAKSLFEENGDLALALTSARTVVESFRVDALAFVRETLEQVAPNVPPGDRVRLQEEALLLLLEATESERFDEARSMAKLLQEELLEPEYERTPTAQALIEWMGARDEAYAEAGAARVLLAIDPSAERANTALARYLCFFVGEWPAGLPPMAMGDDAALAALARQELGGPTELEQRVELAEGWWSAAGEADTQRARSLRRHAAEIYLSCLSELGGMVEDEANVQIARARRDVEPWLDRAEACHRVGQPRLAQRVLDVFCGLRGPFRAQEVSLVEASAPPEPPHSASPLLTIYASRFSGRDRLRKEGQAGKAMADAIERGLDWLARHQDASGRWSGVHFMALDASEDECGCVGAANSENYDVGLTGLALLAFLGDGSTIVSGPHREVVRRGLDWLLEQQVGQGKPSGRFGESEHNQAVYNHAIATLAVVEAYGLSGDPALRAAATQALTHLARRRNPYSAWRYQFPPIGDNDTSVTGWCTMAMSAGKHFGLMVDESAFQGALSWINEVRDPATGRMGYDVIAGLCARDPGAHEVQYPKDRVESPTAIGLLCRFALGQRPKDPESRMTLSAKLILEKPPVLDSDGSVDHYYWYYGSRAMFQMGDGFWPPWRASLVPAVVDSQRLDRHFEGSWDPAGAWGHYGGRLYSTALLTMTLQTPYGYGPLDTGLPIRGPNRFFALMSLAWDERDFSAVEEGLSALREDGAAEDIQRLVRQLLDRETEEARRVVANAKNPTDYVEALESLTKVKLEFGRLEVGKDATLELRRYRTDESVKKELKAEKDLRVYLNPDYSPSRRDDKLRELIEEFPGTQAAEKARAELDQGIDERLETLVRKLEAVTSCYLADLPLEDDDHSVGHGTLGLNGDLGWSHELAGDRVEVGGKAKEHAIAIHPPSNGSSFVRYHLNSQWERLQGGVALNDSSEEAGRVSDLVFEVFVNGEKRPSWSFEWKASFAKGRTISFELGIADAETLELRVTCRGAYYAAHAIWVDPRLSK